jgi:hypothetical protein
VVSLIPLSLCFRGKTPGCNIIRGLLGTRVGLDVGHRTKNCQSSSLYWLHHPCFKIQYSGKNICIQPLVCIICGANALDNATRNTQVPCGKTSTLKDVLLSTVGKTEAHQVIDMETKRELWNPWSSSHAGGSCTLAELGEVWGQRVYGI